MLHRESAGVMNLSLKKISELEQERRKKVEDVEVLAERLFSVWTGTGFFCFSFSETAVALAVADAGPGYLPFCR
jgi:hypothetical protein